MWTDGSSRATVLQVKEAGLQLLNTTANARASLTAINMLTNLTDNKKSAYTCKIGRHHHKVTKQN